MPDRNITRKLTNAQRVAILTGQRVNQRHRTSSDIVPVPYRAVVRMIDGMVYRYRVNTTGLDR